MQLSPEEHYLINPGSVGQPRDGNPEAAYAIFDDQEFSIQFKSVPYDVSGAQRRILAAGLPALSGGAPGPGGLESEQLAVSLESLVFSFWFLVFGFWFLAE